MIERINPTKAVRDYTIYPELYKKTNDGVVSTFGTTVSTSELHKYKGNCHSILWSQGSIFNAITTKFYKASSYGGTDIIHDLSSNHNVGEYIIVYWNASSYGTSVAAQINLSFDGGSTYISIDKSIELGHIDPVVLTTNQHYNGDVRDTEFLYTGTLMYPTLNYSYHIIAFRPLNKLPIAKIRLNGRYSSNYDDGISIRSTNIVEISTEPILVDAAVKLVGEFNESDCSISLNWISPDINYASKLYLVKSMTHTPTSISDGELVFETDDVTVSEFLDENIRRNGTYYYTLFTVDVDGEIHPKSTSTKVEAAVKLKFRYIRDWLNGSTINNGNHWVEIEAYSDGTNVARGKSITHSPNDTSGGTGSTNIPSRVTDGDTNTNNYHEFARPTGEATWVQIDLAQEYDLEKINVRHYNGDGRAYYETRTEVSPDGNAWYTIFDSAISGVYAETSGGKNHTFNILDSKIPNYYDTTPSNMVQNLQCNFNDVAVELTWERPLDDTVTGLIIRRCENRISLGHDDGDLIFESNNLSVNEFTDKKVKLNKVYNYTVYTHNANGEFTPGLLISVITTPLKFLFPKEFKTCGATKNIGPTEEQVSNFYSNSDGNLKGLVTSKEGYQVWTVPKTGTYNIKATGAAGGSQPDYGITGSGRGAVISGDIYLEAGEKLIIVVGQKGETSTVSDTDGGGGGGTFVVKVIDNTSNDTTLPYLELFDCYVEPIIIAGGGGAASADATGNDASISENSTQSNTATQLGQGAKHGSGGGGGGFLSNGKDGGSSSYGGKGFLQGCIGGNSVRKGGFGGGAGGNDENGAGGGGYTGAPGNDGPSGGGGSFVISSATNISKSIATNREDGYVTITDVDLRLDGYLMINDKGDFLYYSVDTENWEVVEDMSIDTIVSYSKPVLPYNLTKLINSGTIIKCTDRVIDALDYNVVAMPKSAVIKQLNDTDLSESVLVGVDIDVTNDVQILVSVDSGSTWKYFNNGEWTNYNNDFIGMSSSIANAISRNIWKKIEYTDSIRFAFIINGTDYTDVNKVKSVKIKTIDK